MGMVEGLRQLSFVARGIQWLFLVCYFFFFFERGREGMLERSLPDGC